MITRRTKIQLLIFALITLLGTTYVGAKYAQLDKLFYDSEYEVVGHFAESGGIYAGAEVAYRGVKIGQVDRLVATTDGVDVVMAIENGHDDIPADALAIVANRSALGEQYVDLQPLADGKPFLVDGSDIDAADTRTPISTSKLLTDISRTVADVDQDALRTVVSELGLAFKDTGEDLGSLIDSSNRFLETATENFDLTAALIRDSNTVLDGQLASATAIRSFSRDLALFSGTLAGSDADLRQLIENGAVSAQVLKKFLSDHGVELSELINNLVTTGEVVVRHLDDVQTLLVAFPYVVEGSYTVTAKDPRTGLYDAHFGLVFTSQPPVCHAGYGGTKQRAPIRTEDVPMNMDARCTEPASKSNPRGAQHAPRAATGYGNVVATYDPDTGKVTWTDEVPADQRSTVVPAPASLGEESWKWLYLQPLGQ
ncbi:MCE family protein [Nocardioides cavernaquae]|uniref:MCE family protein n=1 Tax=Nocardioides cavernaquae TaxID=2321396 RepID=A0A3A5H7A2_9ACTN|nr:MlaD family protein [Nocardioides cavernaquae]RJS46352.1 MCE family protein [Nocardioides cavernaquae]